MQFGMDGLNEDSLLIRVCPKCNSDLWPIAYGLLAEEPEGCIIGGCVVMNKRYGCPLGCCPLCDRDSDAFCSCGFDDYKGKRVYPPQYYR